MRLILITIPLFIIFLLIKQIYGINAMLIFATVLAAASLVLLAVAMEGSRYLRDKKIQNTKSNSQGPDSLH